MIRLSQFPAFKVAGQGRFFGDCTPAIGAVFQAEVSGSEILGLKLLVKLVRTLASIIGIV
jgi:hypothetical protein